jgi:cell division protein FtsA
MPAAADGDFVAGLDVGTSAVKVAVARCRAGDAPSVVGMGMAPASGIRRGVVTDLREAAASIEKAVGEAELTAGRRLPPVLLALSGAHLRGMNTRAVVAVAAPDRRITGDDTARAIAAARAVALPEGRVILETVPQEFVVDGQDGVVDPVGMAAARLEVSVHLVTGSVAAVVNLVECIRRCRVAVDDVIAGPLATADAVLSDDEKLLGAAVVDVGAGTTSVALFDRGALCHTAVLPEGGEHLTGDLAIALRTPRAEAERLKRRVGRTFTVSIDDGDGLRVPPVAGGYDREVPKRLVAETLAPRVQTILDGVADEIHQAGSPPLSAGVVLTGGSAALRGFPDTAETMLRHPVRRAAPQAAGCVADLVNTHAFATAVGLVLRASRARDPLDPGARAGTGATPWAGLVRGRLGVVARWLR